MRIVSSDSDVDVFRPQEWLDFGLRLIPFIIYCAAPGLLIASPFLVYFAIFGLGG